MRLMGRRSFGHVYQRGRSFYVRIRWRDPGTGRTAEHVECAGPDPDAARRLLNRLEAQYFDDLAAGRSPLRASMTLSQWVPTWHRMRSGAVSPQALDLGRVHLEVAVERLLGPLAGLTTASVREFASSLRAKGGAPKGRREGRKAARKRGGDETPKVAPCSPATVNRYLADLSGCLSAAVEAGLIPRNPCLGVRMAVQEEPVAFVSEADARAIEARAPADLRPLVLLANETGLRLGELGRLQWRDLDLEAARVTVRESKNRSVRHVPLTARALEAARGIPRGSVPIKGEDPVFGLSSSARRSLSRSFRVWAKDAGRADLTFHDLRHGWASRNAAAGMDLFVLKDLGGWRSLSMVMRYAHHRPDDAARREVERIEGQKAPKARNRSKTA